MDIKDIIKWFILCFLLLFKLKNGTLVFLFLIAKSEAVDSNTNYVIEVNGILDGWTSKVEGLTRTLSEFNKKNNADLSDYFPNNYTSSFNGKLAGNDDGKAAEMYTEKPIVRDVGVPRTFGRPLKKLTMALVPLAFQVGVASVWMVISALLSLKGVLIGSAILKLLLIAGAAKIGALFAHKKEHAHHQPAWTPQKEVHLHIHNTPHAETQHSHSFEELHGNAPPVWSRDGGSSTAGIGDYVLNTASSVWQPGASASAASLGSLSVGPQTINTPYGSYVRVGPPLGGVVRRKRFTPPKRLYVNVFK